MDKSFYNFICPLTELLRKSAEHTLMDMVQLLFSRLPQFKEDPKWATSLKKVRHRLHHDLVIIQARNLTVNSQM